MAKIITAALSFLVGVGVIGLSFMGITTLQTIMAAPLLTQFLIAGGAAGTGITAIWMTMKGSDY